MQKLPLPDLKEGKLLDYLSTVLLFISLGLLALTTRYVDNIILGKKFVWNYFLMGLTLASLWTYVFYKIKPGYYKGGEKRASAILSQFFSIIILTIFLNAFYTYHTGKANTYRKEAMVVRKGSNVKTGTQYAHLRIDGREERFNPGRDEYRSLEKGDSLVLTIGRGKTNYEFIYSFKQK